MVFDHSQHFEFKMHQFYSIGKNFQNDLATEYNLLLSNNLMMSENTESKHSICKIVIYEWLKSQKEKNIM